MLPEGKPLEQLVDAQGQAAFQKFSLLSRLDIKESLLGGFICYRIFIESEASPTPSTLPPSMLSGGLAQVNSARHTAYKTARHRK